METGSSTSSNSNGVIVTTGEERRMRIENPFTLKVGQVFTGFGIGCGIGIGVGRPLNLGAIPMLNQVMTATRGATDAFSGVGRYVNNSLRKVGAKRIEAGIGCGVGFGHGFGVGLAVKRGVVERIQLYLIQSMTKLMMKSGMPTGLSVGQGILPASLQGGMKTVNEASNQNPLGIANPLGQGILPASLQAGMKTVNEASNQNPLGIANPLGQGILPASLQAGMKTVDEASNQNPLGIANPLGQGILPASLQAGMKTVDEASNQNPPGIANPLGQGILPASLQAGMKTVDEASNQNPLGIANPLEVKVPHSSSPGLITDRNTNSLSSHENETSRANVSSSNASYSSRTEKVIRNFLQSSLVKDEDSTANELSERLRSENNLLHIVLKHQQVIDELMQENEKLRQILVKDLKVSPSKLQTSYSSGSKFTSTECFECRRKQRRRR